MSCRRWLLMGGAPKADGANEVPLKGALDALELSVAFVRSPTSK